MKAKTGIMDITGNLIKMRTELSDPIKYYVSFGGEEHNVNEWIGRDVKISFLNQINCINCGMVTNKSFSQGYCYPCFTTVPQTDPSVIRPELNLAHEGVSRNMEYSKKNDLIDHFVYLSVTSDVKVGVTRHHQIPTRWIDQGAVYAIKFAKTPYRQLAGVIEVALKSVVNDKTNWRKMLTTSVSEVPDLKLIKKQFKDILPSELKKFIIRDNEITSLNYPVVEYPEKVKSISLDKLESFTGKLAGIKGQYLIFEGGVVFNVRKHNGYKVKIEVS